MRLTAMHTGTLPTWVRARGSMLTVCSEPGCTTLTMGGTCVAHDPPVTATFERGRPFVAATAAATERVGAPS